MKSLKIGERNFNIYSDDSSGWEDNTLVDLKLFLCFLNGGTVLDIGANVGLTSVYFAQLSEKVFAFEPSLGTFKNLLLNIESAKLFNIHGYQFGLGNKNEKKILIKPSGSPSTVAHVLTTETHSEYEQEFIQIKKLDKVYKSIGISNVQFLKIDVEGYELDVVYGATKLLKQYKPVLVLEFNSLCLNQFRDMPANVFLHKINRIFPLVYAVEGQRYLDLKSINDRYHVVHENIMRQKYRNLVCAYSREQLSDFYAQFLYGV
jgi:FkbM family methyltransferase